MTITTLKQAKTFGVITKGNSKIHGSTFSTNPLECKTGSKLVNVEGSTCNKCYAIKLSKIYPNALQSWDDNLQLFRKHLEEGTINEWCEAMAYQINKISDRKTKKNQTGAGYHRWFSAGDLDSLEMLEAIVYIAKLTPNVKHWLPTREAGILRQFKNKLGIVPNNLTIRLSDTKIDQEKSIELGFPKSGVHKESTNATVCPAYQNNGECGTCTMCWNSSIEKISYKLH